MSFNLDIKPEEISKYLSEQILKSTIGDFIKEAIDSKLKDSWSLKSDIEKYVQQVIRNIIADMITGEFQEKIKEIVMNNLTQEKLEELGAIAAEKSVTKLVSTIQESRYW